MRLSASAPIPEQAVFQILGFDRLRFVSDVMDAIPQDDHCRLANICFEADGIRATGWVTVQADDRQCFFQIDRRLRTIQGLVRVTQSAEIPNYSLTNSFLYNPE